MSANLCELEHTLGRERPCPESPCPFWVDDGCLVGVLPDDVRRDPSMAPVLLRVRDAIGPPPGRAFLPPGLRD